MFEHGTLIMLLKAAFVVIALVGLTLAQSRKSAKFAEVKSRDGESVCVVDVPIAVNWFPVNGSDVQCGLECIKRNSCKAFNFNSLLGKCNQYETTPTNFSVIPGCKGYTFESINDCLLNNGGCAPFLICSHKDLTVKCSCPRGQKLTADGNACMDCGFDFIPGSDIAIKPLCGAGSWDYAFQQCLSLCPSSRLIVFGSREEFNSVKQYMNNSISKPCYNLGGYWTAKRRLDRNPTTASACRQSPFVWDTNGNTNGLLPAQDWESSEWYSGDPNCQRWPGSFESVVNIAGSNPSVFKFGDSIYWYSFWPLCQLSST